MTALPVTTYTRYVTLASGVVASKSGTPSVLTQSLQIALAQDGGVVLLVNGAVVGHYYGHNARSIEKAIFNNVT
jgi:hypothetical protein